MGLTQASIQLTERTQRQLSWLMEQRGVTRTDIVRDAIERMFIEDRRSAFLHVDLDMVNGNGDDHDKSS